MGQPATRRASRLTQVRRLTGGALRYPRSLRALPRLARSFGHTTLELRMPWLPFDVIDLLEAHVTNNSAVFEYGGGGSSAWFADRVKQVVTVEHDPAWAQLLRTELADLPGVKVITAAADDDFGAYVGAIDAYPDRHFDVVVVDGRQRVRCFQRAITKARPGGLLLLDDVDRQRYDPALGLVDWPRARYDGYAPCKDDIAHTIVFTVPHTSSVQT